MQAQVGARTCIVLVSRRTCSRTEGSERWLWLSWPPICTAISKPARQGSPTLAAAAAPSPAADARAESPRLPEAARCQEEDMAAASAAAAVEPTSAAACLQHTVLPDAVSAPRLALLPALCLRRGESASNSLDCWAK